MLKSAVIAVILAACFVSIANAARCKFIDPSGRAITGICTPPTQPGAASPNCPGRITPGSGCNAGLECCTTVPASMAAGGSAGTQGPATAAAPAGVVGSGAGAASAPAAAGQGTPGAKCLSRGSCMTPAACKNSGKAVFEPTICKNLACCLPFANTPFGAGNVQGVGVGRGYYSGAGQQGSTLQAYDGMSCTILALTAGTYNRYGVCSNPQGCQAAGKVGIAQECGPDSRKYVCCVNQAVQGVDPRLTNANRRNPYLGAPGTTYQSPQQQTPNQSSQAGNAALMGVLQSAANGGINTGGKGFSLAGVGNALLGVAQGALSGIAGGRRRLMSLFSSEKQE